MLNRKIVFINDVADNNSPDNIYKNLYSALYNAIYVIEKGYVAFLPQFYTLTMIINGKNFSEEEYIRFNIPWLEKSNIMLGNYENDFKKYARENRIDIIKDLDSLQEEKKEYESEIGEIKKIENELIDIKEILRKASNLSEDKVKNKKAYVSGPYSNKTIEGLENNVRNANKIGYEVFRLGGYPYIPHNTHYIDILKHLPNINRQLTWEDWIIQDIYILDISDCIVFIKESRGANIELKRAYLKGKEIIYVGDLVYC